MIKLLTFSSVEVIQIPSPMCLFVISQNVRSILICKSKTETFGNLIFLFFFIFFFFFTFLIFFIWTLCSAHLEYAYPIVLQVFSCLSQVNWKKRGLLSQGEYLRPQINIENAERLDIRQAFGFGFV